jgi:triacylglycerol lipase
MNPVVLVHGLWDTARLFEQMGSLLRSKGLQVYSLDLIPNNGDASLEHLANQLADFIRDAFPAAQPVDLVGFSMGGLVARYYVQRLNGLDRVRKLITISSPHKGTWTAFLGRNPGARQMRPGSEFLQDLNRDAAILERIQFTTIWTPFDLMIFPARSSELGCGQSMRVNVAIHRLMVRDRRVLELVHRLLVEPAATAPKRA